MSYNTGNYGSNWVPPNSVSNPPQNQFGATPMQPQFVQPFAGPGFNPNAITFSTQYGNPYSNQPYFPPNAPPLPPSQQQQQQLPDTSMQIDQDMMLDTQSTNFVMPTPSSSMLPSHEISPNKVVTADPRHHKDVLKKDIIKQEEKKKVHIVIIVAVAVDLLLHHLHNKK